MEIIWGELSLAGGIYRRILYEGSIAAGSTGV